MRLRIKNPPIQAHQPRLTKQQLIVLQRLRRPKALHPILPRRLLQRDILHTRMRRLDPRPLFDSLEHPPPLVLPRPVARDAVHDEDRLDGFGA